MLRMYLKTAIRGLKRNGRFSTLNIFGLAVGMAAAILMGLWAQNMLSYDRFHLEEDRLVILNCKGEINGEQHAWKWVPKILGPTLLNELPEVQGMTRYDNDWDFLLTAGNKVIEGNKGSFADPDFFSMFDFPFEQGGINKDWRQGNGIVLTRQYAKTLFGKENPIGQIIKIDSINYVAVTGVLRDFPSNTLFNCNYLLSWAYAKKANYLDSNWLNNNVQTFVKLNKGTNLGAFDAKIKDFIKVHSNGAATNYHLTAEPLSRNFLYNKEVNGEYISGRVMLVRSVILLAIFMVLIACINFMNLSTAQSERRAREVGVKKTLGATKKRLVIQFLMESLVLALISFLVALLLAKLALPFFNHLVDVRLSLDFSVRQVLVALVFVLLTGLIAGSYPAFYLSSFKPILVLNGRFKRLGDKVNIRSVLVVFQFTIAIILVLGTIMTIKNIDYGQNRDLGYNKNGLVYSWLTGHLEQNYLPIRNELLNSGAVSSVTKSMSPVTRSQSNGWGFSWPGSLPGDENAQFIRFSTDADMVQTLGMQLLAGRDIDIYKFPADSTAVVLTAGAVKAMRLKDPIGSIIRHNDINWHVVGVIKDFVIDKAFETIKPMVIEGPKSWFDVIHYRLNPNNSIAYNMTLIKKIFDKYDPGFPFKYDFVDKAYQSKFMEAARYKQIAVFAAGITIFISCLGLIGLMAFMVESKTKEIGIRKVFGASPGGIALLLSRKFVLLILLSFIIASPIGFWIMHKWLSRLDYSVDISIWWFLSALLISLVIGGCTTSVQALKAARVNPVQSLKTE